MPAFCCVVYVPHSPFQPVSTLTIFCHFHAYSSVIVSHTPSSGSAARGFCMTSPSSTGAWCEQADWNSYFLLLLYSSSSYSSSSSFTSSHTSSSCPTFLLGSHSCFLYQSQGRQRHGSARLPPPGAPLRPVRYPRHCIHACSEHLPPQRPSPRFLLVCLA